MKSDYYIYGHYLDSKCIYIGSNCMTGNPNRAYDFSNRNKDYAKTTRGRKQDIEVKILKEFTYEELNNINVMSEEMKLIREYHDKGEALCSHQDYRGKNNPMYGKHFSEESKLKNRLSNLDYNQLNVCWYNQLSNEEKEIFKYNAGKAARGKIWIYKDNIKKYIKPEKLNLYMQQGWIKGRPSKIISKGNKNRDWSKSKFINRTKCLLEHNNIVIEFNSYKDLCLYCKDKYDLSSGTIKSLLNSEKPFVPSYSRLNKAKGLKLKRI